MNYLFLALLTSAFCQCGHPKYFGKQARQSSDQQPAFVDEDETPLSEENQHLPTTSPPFAVHFPERLGDIKIDSSIFEVEAKVGKPDHIDEKGLHRFSFNSVVISYDKETFSKVFGISIQKDYQGLIKLPAPFGDVRMYQDLSHHFPADDPFGEATLQVFSQSIDGLSSVENWDCLRIHSCLIRVVEAGFYFEVDGGALFFGPGADDPPETKRLLEVALVRRPQARTLPITASIDLVSKSVGGIAVAQTLEQTVASWGPSRAKTLLHHSGVLHDVFWFDNDNLLIASPQGQSFVKIIEIEFGYAGSINFPGLAKGKRMNESFSEFFPSPVEDEVIGQAFAKEIGAMLEGQDPNVYNCLKEKICTVNSIESYSSFGPVIAMSFPGVVFYFTNDNRKDLIRIIFQ